VPGVASCYVPCGRVGRLGDMPLLPSPKSIVVEHPLWGVVKIVELTVSYSQEEQNHEDGSQQQGGRQQEDDRVHTPTAWRWRSTRNAPTMTAALERDIRIAAESGLIRPAAAAPTATPL